MRLETMLLCVFYNNNQKVFMHIHVVYIYTTNMNSFLYMQYMKQYSVISNFNFKM